MRLTAVWMLAVARGRGGLVLVLTVIVMGVVVGIVAVVHVVRVGVKLTLHTMGVIVLVTSTA